MSDKFVFRLVMAVSVVITVAVVILNKKILPVPEAVPAFVYKLPKLNAFLNGTCSLLLLLSLYFIRQKNVAVHKKLNLITFALSSLFLLCYITYHWLAQETTYPDGPLRTPYLLILITHIILAAVVLPMVLLSLYYGLKSQQEGGIVYIKKHRKISRWTYPIWLYVTITGVVVYLMISPFYVVHP